MPYLLFATIVGPELPTIGGAFVGGAVFALLIRRAPRSRELKPAPIDRTALIRASAPYLLLLVLVLVTRLLPGLRDLLTSVTWRWSLLDLFRGSIQPLYHPGTLLMVGFLLGSVVPRPAPRDLGQAVRTAAWRLAPVTVALVAMLGLSRLMVHGGLVAALAEAAASAGPGWPLLTPAIGVLGTFVTGSATASNILFTDFQATTADRLNLPLVPLVAAQGFGAAVGNIVCPHNIVAGAATVGIAGREGEVLRSTVTACAAYAIAGGALAFLLAS